MTINYDKETDTLQIILGVEAENLNQHDAGLFSILFDDSDSMISAFKYDSTTNTLDVVFKRSGVYRYFDVPLNVVQGLRNASSKGSFMHSMIIDQYPYKNVR